MRVKELIEKFLEKVLLENHFETYMCYCSHLRCFMIFCEEFNIVDIDDLNENIYLNFVKYCKNKNLCNRTINKRYRLFLQVLKYNKINVYNLENKSLKEKFVRFDMFDKVDLKKIMNYVYNLKNDPINLTHKLTVFLLASTGVRINELLNIKRENINLSDNSILLITTKTDVERYVFFDKYTAELIKEYLKFECNSEYLLFNFLRNEKYTYRSCICFLNKMKKDLNIKKLHPHMFRHTFASNLVLNEAPLFMIQKLLGHSSIRTTEIYVHLNNDNLKKCYDKYFNIA